MSELVSATKQRSVLKRKLTSLEKFVNSMEMENPIISEVESRYNVALQLLEKFEKIQNTIDDLNESDDLDDERELFEDRYHKIIGLLKQHIDNSSRVIKQSTKKVDPLLNVILPKIKLPTFKGDYQQWVEFKSNFKSLIDDNESLTNSQKFQYLHASLEGYAKRIIENIEFTENNYNSAFKLLCDRFDNKKVLVNNHLKSLVNINSIQKESATAIRQMLDTVSKHITALHGLKLSKDDLCDALFIHLISNKLDKVTFREWQEFHHAKELPSIDDFFEFLKSKADLLETIQDLNKTQLNHSYHKSHVNISVNKIKCNYCKENHLIYHCQHFLKLNPKQKLDAVVKNKLCKNCLKTGHLDGNCKSTSCRICHKKHNSLLHNNDEISTASNSRIDETHSLSVQNNSLIKKDHFQILLSTVVVDVEDADGNYCKCRALLDSGAQSNLITKRFANKLKVNKFKANLSIIGINQIKSNLNEKCRISIRSKINPFETSLQCYLVPKISEDIPMHPILSSYYNIPNIALADPDFDKPGTVDLLIGAGLFWDLLLPGKMSMGKGLPTFHNTELGWIVSGSIPVKSKFSICNLTKSYCPEDDQLKRFWELEEVSTTNNFISKDDENCENLFNQSTTRDNEGKFIVKLPLKYPLQLIGNSKQTAINRFLALERKFNHNNDFKNLYKQFIDEYIALGHMTKISNYSKSPSTYFLPHHGVFKESV